MTNGFEVLEVRRATGEAEAEAEGASPSTSVDDTDAREKEDAALAAWVKSALCERRRTGVRLEAEVRRNRTFNSPAILQHMVAYCGIEEHATLRRAGAGATQTDGRQ